MVSKVTITPANLFRTDGAGPATTQVRGILLGHSRGTRLGDRPDHIKQPVDGNSRTTYCRGGPSMRPTGGGGSTSTPRRDGQPRPEGSTKATDALQERV